MASVDVEKAQTFASPADSRDSEETAVGPAPEAKTRAAPAEDYEIVSWDGDDDPACPLNWPARRKWACILAISFGSMSVTCCSSMVTSTYEQIEAEWGISEEVATLGLSVFVLTLGIGPMLMAPLSEVFGRRPIYLVGYLFFFAFQFGVLFAQNVGTYIVCRAILGFAGSAFLSVAGGSVADAFRPQEISGPMAIFTLGCFIGPVGGPVFASAIAFYQDWRFVWVFQAAWCCAVLVLLYLFAPETYALPLLRQKAQKLRARTGNDNLRSRSELNPLSLPRAILKSCYTPFLLLFTEPMATLLCSWTAFYLAVIYAFFSAYDVIFGGLYGFNGWQVGETFWPIGVGTILAALSTPYWTHLYKRRAAKLQGPVPPEELLRKGIAGGLIAPVGLLIFAFTTRASINPAVPLFFSSFLGIGYMLVFMAVFQYLVAAYRPVAASAMALNSFLRSCAAAGLPLGTIQMYHALGITWANALLAFVALAMAPLPIIFFRIGHRIRKNSRFGAS